MLELVPKKEYLWGILLHYFIQKKSTALSQRFLVKTYGDLTLSETTCRYWFKHFKNIDFDVEDKEHSGEPKMFNDEELEALLRKESCKEQTEPTE